MLLSHDSPELDHGSNQHLPDAEELRVFHKESCSADAPDKPALP
jgi:hypothetical protein